MYVKSEVRWGAPFFGSQVRMSMTVETQSDSRDRRQIIEGIVARTGIDEPMIERVVCTFYERARRDALIGPIFESKIHDWEGHIAQLCAFWSSVALLSGRYHGQPMVAHLPLPIDTPEFDRWLALFAETVSDVCPPPAAAIFSTARTGLPIV
jgi:hemoglobin